MPLFVVSTTTSTRASALIVIVEVGAVERLGAPRCDCPQCETTWTRARNRLFGHLFEDIAELLLDRVTVPCGAPLDGGDDFFGTIADVRGRHDKTIASNATAGRRDLGDSHVEGGAAVDS
ncbi:hypothetical protein [Gordonia sp. (in: high G+C Gram-positive bacteria)]|jgi:hypothetical protein|uniref:hypothetical protein n=1 Tax=Gordonia sp. (in: high G+C Gram-positive bacteria) TaxID=84139 RepID=UPI00338F0E15